jgi:hypothetical protein
MEREFIRMKQLFARIISEILYFLGDAISRPMVQFDWAWLYPVYNNLMIFSSNVQDWAGNTKPWVKNND